MAKDMTKAIVELEKRLKEYPDIYEEFVYYREKGDFLCRAQIGGRNIVDILVWRQDRFKAGLDRERLGGQALVLSAFETMLEMAKDPSSTLYKMETETGTDYPEKF